MTDKFLWNNKASTTLSGAHNASTTTINVNGGDGSLFPSPGAGEHFALTLQKSDGTAEVCYCTGRSGDALTVVRGREIAYGAPAAQTYVGGEAVELRVTAGILSEFSQKTIAETISGLKTFSGNNNHSGDLVLAGANSYSGANDYTAGSIILPNGSLATHPANILQIQKMAFMAGAAGGTVDAITATFAPAFAALADGLTCIVRAAGANTITNPTFAPNGLTAKTIVKWGNQVLNVGDILGAGHEIYLRYNSTNDNWELLNPADGYQAAKNVGNLDIIGLDPLASYTAAGDASIDITDIIDGTYDKYFIDIVNVIPATDASYLRMRVSNTNGSTWESGASDYDINGAYTTYFPIGQDGANSQGSSGGESGNFEVTLFNPYQTSFEKGIRSSGAWVNSAGRARHTTSANNLGTYATSGAVVDAVQFYYSSGNVESGEFRIYGVRT